MPDLIQKLDKPAKAEIQKLAKLKEQEKLKRGESFDGVLRSWDLQYYHTQVLESEYQINHEKIKEYFPLHKVTEGLLGVFSEVLGVRFEQMSKDKVHVWHEDVNQFEVYDSATGTFLGHLYVIIIIFYIFTLNRYMDLFPRDGKYGHAAEFDLVKGFTHPDGRRFKFNFLVFINIFCAVNLLVLP